MEHLQINPSNHAVINLARTPDVEGVNLVMVSVNVICDGNDGEVQVTWKRDYPKDRYPNLESEWDVPHFDMPIWDACCGTIPRADRVRMYECLLDVTDEYFDLYLKGK